MFKSKRTALALVGVFSLMLVLLLVACAAPAPAITLAPTSVAQGGNVTVTGVNFQSGEKVTLAIGNVTLASPTAGTDGKFSAGNVTVSKSVAAGAATVTAKGDKGANVTAALTVTAAPK